MMGVSVLVVLTVFERLAGLHTLETRESIQQFLSQPPGDDRGIGVQGALSVIRTLGMVAAGCATAAAILGYQVLRRSRGARLALTLLAVPLFLTGMVSGGFLSSVVAAAAVMLWFQPSRDWFDGVVRESRPEPEPRATSTPPEEPVGPPAAPSGARPFEGFGAAPAVSAGSGAAPGGTVRALGTASRPSAVVWLCALTWVFSALAVIVMASSIAILVANPGLVFDELHRQNPDLARQGVSDQVLKTATYAIGGVVIAWSLGAIVLAVLVFRRTPWARLLLVVSTSAAAGLLLIATVVQPVLAVPLAATVVTLALLIRPDVRNWFS
jgi:hypothetical protein